MNDSQVEEIWIERRTFHTLRDAADDHNGEDSVEVMEVMIISGLTRMRSDASDWHGIAVFVLVTSESKEALTHVPGQAHSE